MRLPTCRTFPERRFERYKIKVKIKIKNKKGLWKTTNSAGKTCAF